MIHSLGPALAQRRARTLLAAWNSGNLARLEDALNADWDLAELPMPAIESERIELVGEVVDTIRGWMVHAKSASELQAALILLRHLAAQESVRLVRERRYDTTLAGSRSI